MVLYERKVSPSAVGHFEANRSRAAAVARFWRTLVALIGSAMEGLCILRF